MDWNNDGKKDLISGQSARDGRLSIFLNTGTDASPVFSGRTYLQVGGVPFKPLGQSTPFIVDWNNDGKKDVLCGAGVDSPWGDEPNPPWIENNGMVYYLENTGTDAAPVFSSSTFIQDAGANLDAGKRSAPIAVDWDRDGAKDLIVGNYQGKLKFYRNIGTDAAPAFKGCTFIQAGGSDLNAGHYSRPALGDLDHDGVQDLVVGSFDGTVIWYHARFARLRTTIVGCGDEAEGLGTGGR